MKILCNHFGDPTFSRLAAALRESVRLNAPSAEWIEVVTERPNKLEGLSRHFTDNHAKLRVWRAAVHAEPDGTLLVLTDADMLVLGDLRPAFDEPFDIGWTHRPGRIPVNSGVVYVRCNSRSRALMDAWVERDRQVMDERLARGDGNVKGACANQAAFLSLMIDHTAEQLCTTRGLPCRIWNCVDQTWDKFNENTRVLHVKGRLRDLVLGRKVIDESDDANMRRMVSLWHIYDAQNERAGVGGAA